MIPLPHPNLYHLSSAIGWLELGNPIEANEELERIEPKHRVHPDVLAVRWSIYAQVEKWPLAFEVAKALTKLAPDNHQGWVFLSISHYRLGRTQEAWDCLSSVADKFPGEWLIPYNLACYAAQLGRLEEAERLIRRAIDLGDAKQVRMLVLNDPDLSGVREQFKLT